MATKMAATAPHVGNWDAEMDALHEKTQALNLYEFWSVGKQGEHEAVRDLARFDRAVPHIWKYRDIRPCLVKAGELIGMDESERRSLIMCNPALKGLIATTTTMFAAYRINNPDEIAPAHRHTQTAFRSSSRATAPIPRSRARRST